MLRSSLGGVRLGGVGRRATYIRPAGAIVGELFVSAGCGYCKRALASLKREGLDRAFVVRTIENPSDGRPYQDRKLTGVPVLWVPGEQPRYGLGPITHFLREATGRE